MIKAILSCALIFNAATSLATTLEEALVNAYEHNEQLQIIRTEFLKEIEAFPNALSRFMPKISTTFSHSNNKTFDKVTNRNNTRTRTSKSESYNKRLAIEQSIFDGWSSVSALKSARESFKSSRAKYYHSEQEEFLKLIQIYLNCVSNKEKYRFAQMSVAAHKTQLESIQARFKLGAVTATDVASAKESLATAKSEKALSHAQHEKSKAAFYRAFNMAAVNLQTPSITQSTPYQVDKLIQDALNNNFTIEHAKHQVQSLKAQEAISRAEILPKLSLQIVHGTNISPHSSERTDNRVTTQATISANIPILSKGGAEYSAIRTAKYNTRNSAVRLEYIKKQVKEQCKAFFVEYNAHKLSVDATKQAVQAAQIAYDGMLAEEHVGAKNILDVLKAEERLNKARGNSVDALQRLTISLYQIKALFGYLTAKAMNLKVQNFSPENEFKKVKMKIVGF